MSSATEGPRCPLGFTGTPPVGHPSIPGLSHSSSSSSSSPSSSKTTASLQNFLSNLLSQPWSNTHTMLLLDALFILGATLVAIYWDRIPVLKALKGGAAGQARPASGAAGSK
ncbi:hypothetical protein A4X06_0g711 [Tilletia controversa]|uniref:Uncharacterized protein n=2 Tax=Tilletia TaxID=13289 RepID=A0A8X7N0W9_9BASI|nr:hypothetical protein CF336_g4744 [Tilletia laevis]KAE8195479.1 hypothetical protein CF328_g4422 [Tilletia controversa]KAE8200617.1 hypothetical protein CF335_g3921 [Tilletia laevis]KAE8252989.1 hypothetical protein A4X03_0g6015 [Tilletia caries]KAE8254824.1 hypothetical protein A4X06_0g711 [Tilletia controversa]